MIKKIYFFFYIYLLQHLIIAQAIKEAFGEHDFQTFTVEDGLIQSTILKIYQDSRGYLWIGTMNGVSRFDGINFINYNNKNGLCGNIVYGICELSGRGQVVFGTNKGLCIFDGFKFTNYTDKDGLPYTFVWTVKSDKQGKLWVGTGNGVAVFDPGNKSFEVILPPDSERNNEVRSILIDDSNNVYLGAKAGLYKYVNGKLSKILDESICRDVHDMVLSENGELFIATWGPLLKYDSKQVKILLPHLHSFPCLTKDKKNNIWIGTWENGLLKFDGKKFEQFTTHNGLPLNSIWSLDVDREGNIWIGTFGSGICRYSGSRFIAINKRYGLAGNIVVAIEKEVGKKIWIATEDGISTCEDGNIMNYTKIASEQISKVTDLIVTHDKKEVLITRYSGYGYRYYDGKFHKDSSLGGFCIIQDQDMNFWMGGDGYGFKKIDKEGKETYYEVNYNLWDLNRILNIYQDRNGAIWGCNNLKGINYLMNDTVILYASKNSPFSYKVNVILQDNEGYYWIGSNGYGVYKASFYNGKFTLVDSISTLDGLSNDYITFLYFDKKGENLWIGTNNGLNKMNLITYNRSKRKIITIYDKYKGFKGLECTGDIIEDDDGKLWIGTINGVFVYNPKEDFKNTLPPVVTINGIKLFYQNIDWKQFTDSLDLITGLPVHLKLPYDKNHITFEFTGISLTEPGRVRFKYKLENFEKDWSPLSSKNTAVFTSLPPGRYDFKILAVNSDGIWTEIPTVYSFEITPPWWQTWWFKITLTISSIGIIYFYLKWRERKLQILNKVLEEKVKQRTLQIMQQKKELENQKKLLEEKNKEITDSIIYAKRIQDAILPSESKWQTLLPDSFIFYLPKDIVAGDFYWLEETDDYIFVAAADCTGHGVPGAMVSVVCSNALSKSVLEEKIFETDKILNRTKEIVTEKLSASEKHIQDGMDVALVRISKKNRRQIQFSGANRPLLIIGQNGMQEIQGDKQPVGLYDSQESFTAKELELSEDQEIFLFTDGFADQFGGEKGKKMGNRRFKEILQEIYSLSCQEQQAKISEYFTAWKQSEEQLDDVTVVGIKI